MKKMFFTFALLSAVLSVRGQQNYYVCKSDKSYQTIAVDRTEDINFSDDGSNICFTLSDNTTGSFALSQLDSVVFTQPAAYGTELTYSKDFDVTFDADDENNITELTETVTSVEEETNDYNDFIENYSVNNTITIIYDGNTATYTYTGSALNVTVAVKGADVTVTSAKKKMKYVLQGTTSNGSFKIYSDYKYAVELDNVNITNPVGPAINIQSGKTVYVILPEASVSTLCDGVSYAAATVKNGKTEDQKGTFFSEGQLIISGAQSNPKKGGTLNITSLYGHALCSDDYIRMRGGTLNLTSLKDGINTNDHFTMARGTISIQAGDDGIDVGKGHVELNGGKIIVTSVDEGITASYDSTDVTINPYFNFNAGFVNITTTGEKGMALKTSGAFNMTGGVAQLRVTGDGSKGINCDKNVTIDGGKITILTAGSVNAEGSSAGGVKSEGAFTQTGGALAVKSTGNGAKGINSSGNLTISGGMATLIASGADYQSATAGDTKSKGISSDAAVLIEGGTTRIYAHDAAVSTLADLTVNNGVLHGFTSKKHALSTGGNYIQRGGWVVTGTK